MTTALPAALRRSLRDIFGLRALRDGQHEVISRVLAGRDTLAIMPTGAGKSLCYQLPALHLDGTTVVVSPLIALMKDQAGKLEDAGVLAEQLNSARSAGEQDASMARIAGAQSDIVFATPERLADPGFRATLAARRVALLVIDEAHCISQWGHDFRPAYLEIGAARVALGRPPVLALTATATTEVAEDIRRQLGLRELQVVNTGMFRDNLRLRVVQVTNDEEKLARLRETLAASAGSGIVYVSTVKACTEVFEALQAVGESVTMYHGKLPAAERHANQDAFMGGQRRVVVATNAFGMGIDKADLRFVVHYQMPGSPLAYYQEAGRAGRDGEPAQCVLLFDRRDRRVQQFFLVRRHPDAAELARVLDALALDGDGATPEVLSKRLPGMPSKRLATLLAALRGAGLARGDAIRRWRAGADSKAAAPRLQKLADDAVRQGERDHEALERMVTYAQTGFCRWRVLLEAFDESPPFPAGCGHCDSCERLARAPADVLQDDAAQAVARGEPAPFAVGQPVRAPRFGRGIVRSANAGEVLVEFPDGAERSFVPGFLDALAPTRPRGRQARARRAASVAAPSSSMSTVAGSGTVGSGSSKRVAASAKAPT